MFVSKMKLQVVPGGSRNRPGQPDLGHGHGAVALVVSKLGLLVGRQGQRRVLQLGERRPDGQAEDLLEPLVDVDHEVTTAGPLLLQRLRTHIMRGRPQKAVPEGHIEWCVITGVPEQPVEARRLRPHSPCS